MIDHLIPAFNLSRRFVCTSLFSRRLEMLNFIVRRKKESYDFKANPSAPGSFSNNWKNNSIDTIAICDEKAELARFKCQTVANYCFGDYATADTVEYGDTIRPGYFKVKCFVEPRNFHGEIHGIIETRDIDGQWIDQKAMQTTKDGFQNGRFLIHDRFSKKYNADTNYAWSAGCFILSSFDLKALNTILHAYKVKSGDVISGELLEV